MKIKNIMKHILIAVLFIVSNLSVVFSEDLIVFEGKPYVSVTVSGDSPIVKKLSKSEALEYKCRIVKIKDKFYWASRENVELRRVESGIYVIFQQVGGVGYVKILPAENKKFLFIEDENYADYVEHISNHLSSTTYYGKN